MCDSIWCCWLAILDAVGHFFKVTWPFFAVYGVLYAIGAAAFLASLRFKSVNGRLQASRSSVAFKIAHPYRFGQIRAGHTNEAWTKPTSICALYAAMFNMLLFIWPVLLLFFAAATTVGSVVLMLVQGKLLKPNLSENGFMQEIPILTRKGKPLPAVLIVLPLGLIGLALFKFTALLHLLGFIGWVLLCVAPIIVFITICAFTTRKVVTERNKEGTTVNAMREAIVANKESYCKIVEITK